MTTEALKQIIHTSEEALKTISDETQRRELKRDIEDAKDRLVTVYNDITYSTAMTFNEYEKWIRQQGKQQKHKTGISFIDNVMGGHGIAEESFVNITGVPGSGKSTLGIQILLNVAKNEKAYFISLEMGKFKTYNKIAGMITTSEQRSNLFVDIWTDDVLKLERDIELFARNGCKFFLLDSKMKLSLNENLNSFEKIVKISGMLSKLTQKLGIIIILINQITETRGKAAIRGGIEQEYDTDLHLHIDIDNKDENVRILNILKNRQTDIKKKIKYGLDFQEINTIEMDGYTMDMPATL